MTTATASSQIAKTHNVADGDGRLHAAVERLVAATDPDSIILFGSRGRGDHREGSDYDLFVLVPETRPFGRKPSFWLWHLVKDVALSIDVLIRQTAHFERLRQAINTLEHAIATEAGRKQLARSSSDEFISCNPLSEKKRIAFGRPELNSGR